MRKVYYAILAISEDAAKDNPVRGHDKLNKVVCDALVRGLLASGYTVFVAKVGRQ